MVGGNFVRGIVMRRIVVFLLWIALGCGAASAQEAGAGWLGVELKDPSKEEADKLGWEAPRGAKVVRPVPGSPAEAAGLLPDDVLVSLDGVEIENFRALIEALSKRAVGAEIRLAIIRAGREKRLGIKLGARPAQFAAAKPAADGPLPMLDTGGHMALIKGLAFTPDGRQLVSASDDKTIRVWDIATGKTLRTIRGEAAPGDPGKIYAMALSPDGKWLAAGGWTHWNCKGRCGEIRLYDFASGKLVALLKGHENVVYGLAFSPDGQRLISGSFDNSAIIWDVAARQALHLLKGHRDHVTTVGFTPDGARAVTGSADHELRLWRVADGALLRTMTGHRDQVLSLALAPDGRIASGDVLGEIRLWDGRTGAFLRTLVWQATAIGSLSFSPDGKMLLSGVGTTKLPTNQTQLSRMMLAVKSGTLFAGHVYDAVSGREIVSHGGYNNIVVATAISADGRWAATGGGDDEAIHVWELRNGVRRQDTNGQPLNLHGTGRIVWAAGFSADGRQAGWGNEPDYKSHNDRGPLQQALTLPGAKGALTAPQELGSGAAGVFRRAEASHGTWSLSHRKGGTYGYDDAILDISEGGKIRASIERGDTDGGVHRTYSFTPDGETIISGGNYGALTAYSRDGKKLGDFVGHESDIFSVAPSPDGRYLLSGSADQTLRLWNLKTRELLVTLFQGKDGEWVMWTPQGFYGASGPGAELIGWQINHGPEFEADYITAAQLRTHLNRPDIVARAIELASAEAAVKEAHGADFKLTDLLAKPVPRLRIVSPETQATLRGGHALVTVELEATPDPVKLIRIQVNGRQIAEKQPPEGRAGFAAGALMFEVPLAKGTNKIAIAAVNDTGETVATVSLSHEGEGDLDKRGTLYILAIGVDDYKGLGNSCGDDGKQSCDLHFAGADAKAFAEAMEARGGPLHARVVKRVLVNGAGPGDAPTAANILDALGALRAAEKNDTVMLFVSGHGINEGPNYRFAPTDAEWGESTTLRPATVVPWYAFQEALSEAGGRRMLFLDTCHSGNAFNQKLLGDSYEANIVVYSAARWDQLALEDPKLGGGHGLFTYALVEGVDGGARDAAGQVRTEGLRDFLKGRVQTLAAKLLRQQEPQYFRARDAQDYLLAIGY
jgi:WD40 repeat protein